MNVFACKLYEFDGFCMNYLQKVEHIFAANQEEARNFIAKKWQIRKNKKGLEISQIEFIKVKRIKKSRTELVKETTYFYWLGNVDTNHYEEKDYYVCSNCGKEVYSTGEFCKHCGGYFG